MAMATEMYCDGCGTTLHLHGIHTKGSMIKTARKNGWSIGKWDLCETCKKQKSKLLSEGYIH